MHCEYRERGEVNRSMYRLLFFVGVAFAVPTMLFANIVVVQYCVTTKAAPPKPMQKRTMQRLQNEFTDMPNSVKTAIQESSEN